MSSIGILQRAGKLFLSGILIFVLSWGLAGCGGDRIESKVEQPKTGTELTTLAEAAPPEAIAQLDRSLVRYQPQVTIITPAAGEILDETDVSVTLRVDDLPIYRDRDLGLGPHLALILDNEPIQEIDDLEEPFVLENVLPGTHTLRVFAVKPWGESFKNEGAYAQTTFSLFAPTPQNTLNASEPILTYNSPQGDYGAEPILLDFYVANAPLHLVARESNNDDIADWHIRVNVNGTSFLLDRWTPIYLKGFEPGINWVKLEFLDEYGNPVENGFNTSVRLFNYQPDGQDTLSQLLRGEIAALDAGGIVDPTYQPVETVPVIEEPSAEIPDIDEEIIPEIPAIDEEEIPEIPEPIELEENPAPDEEISPSELEDPLLEEAIEEVEIPEASEETILPEETVEPEVTPIEVEAETSEEAIAETEETAIEEVPIVETIEEPNPIENEVEESEVSTPEPELLETETVEPIEESTEVEIETQPSDTAEIQAVEEEEVTPENPEVSESDRGFLQGLLNRFMGQTEAPPEAIDEVTEEQTSAVETIPETLTLPEG